MILWYIWCRWKPVANPLFTNSSAKIQDVRSVFRCLQLHRFVNTECQKHLMQSVKLCMMSISDRIHAILRYFCDFQGRMEICSFLFLDLLICILPYLGLSARFKFSSFLSKSNTIYFEYHILCPPDSKFPQFTNSLNPASHIADSS